MFQKLKVKYHKAFLFSDKVLWIHISYNGWFLGLEVEWGYGNWFTQLGLGPIQVGLMKDAF